MLNLNATFTDWCSFSCPQTAAVYLDLLSLTRFLCLLFLFFRQADEEALRKKIADELYKDLKQERAKVEQELQAWWD